MDDINKTIGVLQGEEICKKCNDQFVPHWLTICVHCLTKSITRNLIESKKPHMVIEGTVKYERITKDDSGTSR